MISETKENQNVFKTNTLFSCMETVSSLALHVVQLNRSYEYQKTAHKNLAVFSLSLSDIKFPPANKKNCVLCTFFADNILECVRDIAYVIILNKAGLMYWSMMMQKTIFTSSHVCVLRYVCNSNSNNLCFKHKLLSKCCSFNARNVRFLALLLLLSYKHCRIFQ